MTTPNPNRFTTVQVGAPSGGGNPTGTQLWDGRGDAQCLLINLSPTVTVYIDTVNSIITTDPYYNIPLLPYASIGITSPAYGIVAPGQSAIVAVVPGGVYAQDPLQIATAIAQMGAAPAVDGVNGFIVSMTQVTSSETITPMNGVGGDPPAANGRIWNISLAATVSASVSNAASARIEHSRFLNRLLELDFQPPASGQPQYGNIVRSFPGGIIIEPGDTLSLDLTNATGLSWFAAASFIISSP